MIISYGALCDVCSIGYVMLLGIKRIIRDKIMLSHKGSIVISWFQDYVNLGHHILGVYKPLYLIACFTIIKVMKRWRTLRCELLVYTLLGH